MWHPSGKIDENAKVSLVRQSESFIYTGGYIYQDPEARLPLSIIMSEPKKELTELESHLELWELLKDSDVYFWDRGNPYMREFDLTRRHNIYMKSEASPRKFWVIMQEESASADWQTMEFDSAEDAVAEAIKIIDEGDLTISSRVGVEWRIVASRPHGDVVRHPKRS
jgi:hypothetical protein